MPSIKCLIFFMVLVTVSNAQDDDDGDYDGDAGAGAAQPAGWGDGFFGGDGGDDEGFAAASGQQPANTDEQTPDTAGGAYTGSQLYGGQEGIGGLYGALGVASNQKPVVNDAPKRK